MKKIFVAAGGIAVLGLIGAPYLTGVIAESETRRLIQGFNQQSELYGTLDIVNYDRGFASSNVSYQYALSPSWAAVTGYDQTIQYDCDYSHGITSIDYDCHLRGNQAYQAFIDEHFSGNDPLSMTGAISAAGGVTQVLENKAIDYSSSDGVVIRLSPSKLFLESDLDFTQLDSTADIGALEFVDERGSFMLSEAVMDMSFKPTKVGLYEGEYVFSVNKMLIDGPEATVDIKEFKINADSEERGAKTDSKVKFELASVVAKSPAEQREFSADNVAVTMDVLGLNSEALVEYQTFARNLQIDLAANVEQGGQPEMDPIQLMALIPILEQMLDKDLKVDMDATANVFGSPNTLGFDLTLLEKTSFAQLSALAYNQEQVLQNMNIALNASLNKELVDINPMIGALMASSPLIESRDGNYETQIKLGAEPSLNGQAVTFQELQNMLLGGVQ